VWLIRDTRTLPRHPETPVRDACATARQTSLQPAHSSVTQSEPETRYALHIRGSLNPGSATPQDINGQCRTPPHSRIQDPPPACSNHTLSLTPHCRGEQPSISTRRCECTAKADLPRRVPHASKSTQLVRALLLKTPQLHTQTTMML
jgi:hypothetical protein